MTRIIPAVIFLMVRVVLYAQEAPSVQAESYEVHLRAIVEDVVPLAHFSGEVIPVDVFPRFALTLRVESVEPAVEEFVSRTGVTLAIHSPSLLFAGRPTKGRTYNFYLLRKTEDSRLQFFGLRVGKKLLPTDMTADTEHGVCAENDDPVGYPLKGWVGYTNTGESVVNMTVKAFTSLEKPAVAITKTDAAGRFSFPTLRPGRFHLRASKKLVGATVRADDVVTVRKGKNRIVCLVAEAEEDVPPQ